MPEQINSQKPSEANFESYVASLKERVAELYPELFRQYKTIHEHPELGGQEFETAKIIKQTLSSLNIPILAEGLGGAGIVAEIIGQEDGPTIALRADIDALPVTEDPSHEIKSEIPGKMHACGHDVHTTSLLGAAQVLKEMADKGQLAGRVVLIFQSNEEKAITRKSGSIPVIKFLETEDIRSRIKAFFALHVFAPLERGTVLLADRLQYAGSSFINVRLTSNGGHGSDIKVLPDIDYILSDIKIKVADLLTDYYMNDEAVVDSMAPKINHEADNIILSAGGRSWVIRIVSEDYKRISREINQKIKQIVENSISSHVSATRVRAEKKSVKKAESDYEVGVEIEVKPNTRPTIYRDEKLVGIVDGVARGIFDKYQRISKGILGTDDFSFFLEEFRGLEIPGVYMAVGGSNKEKGYNPKTHHSPDFAVDPESIKDLVEVHVATAVKALVHFKK